MPRAELPAGYPGNEYGDQIGMLIKSLYGTRDAAHNWVEEVARYMKSIGFRRGKYNPCLYFHEKRGIEVMVHGDDFLSVGDDADLKWFNDQLSKRFKMKTSIVGEDQKDLKEARVLNRIVRWTPNGWEYEHDQRHSELIIQELGLEAAKPAESPGEKAKVWEAGATRLRKRAKGYMGQPGK